MAQGKRTKPNKIVILGGLVLFFCLFFRISFAATPTIASISPTSGSTASSLSAIFQCNYSDTDGWANLKEAYLLISTSSASLVNSIYLYYDQDANLLYLRNDANTAWLGGYVPGSSNIIENSYVKVNCAVTSIVGSGNILTVKWYLTFKSTYSGKIYNTYLYIKDDTGGKAGWTKKGTYTVNKAPTIGTIIPSSGTGQANTPQIFTTTYSDPDGWQNIQYVYFRIDSSTYGTNCPYFYYKQNTNSLYLRNDANNAWLGPFAPGSSNIIENSYAKLDCAATTVSGSGTTMTVNWAVTIKPSFTGTKNTYLYVMDDCNVYVSYSKVGTWAIPNNSPTVGTIIPSSGSSFPDQAVNFTTSYSDLDTWLNIQYVYFLINTSTSGTSCLYAQYNQNSNKLYLRNDANSSWLGGYAPGSANTIENSYVKLDCAATTISGSGNDLTVNWKVTFKSTFIGTKKMYLYVKDDPGAYKNWTQAGSWIIQADTTPPVITLNPVISPTNQNVVLSYTVSDDITPTNEIVVTGDNSPYTQEGTHNVTLTAKDKTGNTSSASISFTIDKTAPVIVINSPQNGSVVEDSPVQFQGTVDGVSFSESRTLNPGQNTLTKTSTDSAGNTASASITVYLYMGELIGPEGGVVTSQDGKVKVVIPQGALTTPTRIRISRVNNDSLKDATPGGRTLLSAVECKPYGLIFNQSKPVELIYSLDQAVVPGTAVELGLYDSVQDKIISTGQITTVPVDGYTVSFALVHFSTYAALEYLTPQSTPIGSGVKIPLPDLLTGAFSHAIPITVPPGRKGMQPAIGLSYRSSNSNSWVGLGFSLNPGYIVRSTRLGPPTYNDAQDTFYFVTDAGTTELVNLIDNLYQAKVESSFTKFFKEADDTWRAVGKDGSTLRFGQVSEAKETSASGTFSWYLTKAVDTNGNYIEYQYVKDQAKSYLWRINYTGNEMGVSPANTVEFSLESRNDITSSYISTSKITTAKRLKEIEVRQGYDLVWSYELGYNYSPDTNRSLLKSIVQKGSDGKSLPAQTLSYQQVK